MTIIDRIRAQQAARLYAQSLEVSRSARATAAMQRAGKVLPRQDVQSADPATLSDNARSMLAAHAAVQNAPDVRRQKVTEIKQRLRDGAYQVSARVLARRMLDVPTYS